MGTHNLTRTAAALEAYDAAYEAFHALDARDDSWDEGESNKLAAEMDHLAREVGIAFGHDTADLNNFETCATCVRPGPPKPLGGDADLSFVRRMVQRFQQEVALSDEIVDEIITEEQAQ